MPLGNFPAHRSGYNDHHHHHHHHQLHNNHHEHLDHHHDHDHHNHETHHHHDHHVDGVEKGERRSLIWICLIQIGAAIHRLSLTMPTILQCNWQYWAILVLFFEILGNTCAIFCNNWQYLTNTKPYTGKDGIQPRQVGNPLQYFNTAPGWQYNTSGNFGNTTHSAIAAI